MVMEKYIVFEVDRKPECAGYVGQRHQSWLVHSGGLGIDADAGFVEKSVEVGACEIGVVAGGIAVGEPASHVVDDFLR